MEGPRPRKDGRAWPAIVAAALAAAAPAACSTHQGTTALSFMRQARESPDPNTRYRAFSKLSSPNAYDNDAQKADAVRLMAEALESSREPVASRAVICRSLGTLRRPEAREALLKAIDDPEPLIRTEALRALGRVGKPEDATLLVRAMTADTQADCRVAAIDGLADLKPPDVRVKDSLVQGMDHEDPAIRLASLRTLRTITGRDLGTEVGPWRKLVQMEEQPDPKGQATKPDPRAKASTGPIPR